MGAEHRTGKRSQAGFDLDAFSDYIPTMFPFLLFLVVAGILCLCVAGMSIGVMAGRKPIQHCGNGRVDENGKRVECALCGNKECKNK